MDRSHLIWKLIIVFISFVLIRVTFASSSAPPFSHHELNSIKEYLFANISARDGSFIKKDLTKIIYSKAGAVIASPSHGGPSFSMDYQLHWTRDAALTMAEVVNLYAQADAKTKLQLKMYLKNYITFEQTIQQTALKSNSDLGEPKYNVDGTVWSLKWARPQNDGPALRALTMIALANLFIQENEQKELQDSLLTLIETDLDYIISHWQTTSYDVWEELAAEDHFFNKMVQRKALYQAATLFKKLGKIEQAENYSKTAAQINQSLEKHWNANRGYLVESLTSQDIKGGGLNSAILLGILYGDIHKSQDHFALDNDDVLSTVSYLRNMFAHFYKLNTANPKKHPLIGRYTSDVYDGNLFAYGNPWFLTTNALAQYYYSLATILIKKGVINITKQNIPFFKQLNPAILNPEKIVLAKNREKFYSVIHSLMMAGDNLLLTIKNYSACYSKNNCFHLSEQIDRSSGAQASAKDLTWSYATLLSAMQARTQAEEALIAGFYHEKHAASGNSHSLKAQTNSQMQKPT